MVTTKCVSISDEARSYITVLPAERHLVLSLSPGKYKWGCGQWPAICSNLTDQILLTCPRLSSVVFILFCLCLMRENAISRHDKFDVLFYY